MHIDYNPKDQYAPSCVSVITKLKTFIEYIGIDFILHKGGMNEKEICRKLCVPSYNIENYCNTKIHDQQTEIRYYYNKLHSLSV